MGLGLPATRALESGAADTLTGARTLEISGTYRGGGISVPASGSRIAGSTPVTTWTIDLQVVRPDARHLVVIGPDLKVEAIVLGSDAYFRGSKFLSNHLGPDPLSQSLVKAAGNAWWKGSPGFVPQLPDLTDGAALRSTFLGPVVRSRTDHVSVDGIDAVELSGPRADLFIAAQAPHNLLRVHLKKGTVIDGISEADLKFKNFDKAFGIAPPSDVIDFSNLSTLPPVYTVVSVDTSRCATPCLISVALKNLGGMTGAVAPSTVNVTITEAASAKVLGSCQAQVTPDIGYNATTSVACTANVNGGQENAAIVTAAVDNPGRGTA